MSVAERTYEQIALENPDRQLELHHGVLREKPPMSFAHNRVIRALDRLFHQQLDLEKFVISVNTSRVRRSDETVYYIPDLAIVPVALTEAYRDRPAALEVYAEPLPLVVEIWSPSTGGYDIDSKLPGYKIRGDQEIWRLHPFARTLTAWRRQPDGSYDENVYSSGTIQPIALPGVTIDLAALFR